MPRQFDYDPDPGFDKLADCFSAGWKYIRQDGDPEIGQEDPESQHFAFDPLLDRNRNQGMKLEDRSLDRAVRLFNQSDDVFAAYVMGVGVVYDVSADQKGRTMVLTSLDHGIKHTETRNTYTDAQRRERAL